MAAEGWSALGVAAFRLILTARLSVTLGIQVMYVAVGWNIYAMTGDVMALGLSGLAEAVPSIVVSLLSGYVADRFNRKTVFLCAAGLQAVAALLLVAVSLQGREFYDAYGLAPYYGVLVLTGFARGFMGPSLAALWGGLLPRELLANGATWYSTIYNAGAVTGPALGGVLYGFAGATVSYMTAAGFVAVACMVMLGVRAPEQRKMASGESRLHQLTVGLKHIFSTPVLLGAMLLDMLAVLFGGALALLPAYAKDVLHTGPEGLGWLRAATFIGSISMGAVIAFVPPRRRSGWILLGSVAGYGVCMAAFAYSDVYWLSFAILAASGAFDSVSMVIRGSITQLMTPDDMRGRVSAASGIFIVSSNEIGAFESGVAARYLGLQPSVLFGGVMTVIVVAAAAVLSPKLRSFSMDVEG
ncbi:MAG: MFS transporter [Candidatus Kapabacteria bacterium]|nr:MFS transporter [Candidatus Kapabacteria bacterium]